jgi:signal peptidase
MRAVRIIRRLATGALLLTALLALVGSLAVRTDVIRVSRVLTGSMAPVVPAGSVVVSRPTTAGAVRQGQLVMFLPPAPFDTGGTPIVHRVVEIRHEHGEILLRTKGDANAARDPWTLDASRTTLHRVAWSSPAAGRAADLLARGGGSLLLSVVVALVAARVLAAMWRPRRGRRRAGRHRAGGLDWLRGTAVS